MKSTGYSRCLEAAMEAARQAGGLMRGNLLSPKKVHATAAHDIKLELDVRCQRRIERILGPALPGASLLGEEDISGDPEPDRFRWVVDPIDGTVNYAHGLPHACVSIALQERGEPSFCPGDPWSTRVGVVHDPFRNELWTAVRGQAARLNGRPIRVSDRAQLRQAIVALGSARDQASLEAMIERLRLLSPRVRKIRIMGSAALDLVYVAAGRLDAYLETGLRLWDIAAGGLILECAGGEFLCHPLDAASSYRIWATNGHLRRPIARVFPQEPLPKLS